MKRYFSFIILFSFFVNNAIDATVSGPHLQPQTQQNLSPLKAIPRSPSPTSVSQIPAETIPIKAGIPPQTLFKQAQVEKDISKKYALYVQSGNGGDALGYYFAAKIKRDNPLLTIPETEETLYQKAISKSMETNIFTNDNLPIGLYELISLAFLKASKVQNFTEYETFLKTLITTFAPYSLKNTRFQGTYFAYFKLGELYEKNIQASKAIEAYKQSGIFGIDALKTMNIK